jgi:hypothetical protein
LADFFMMGRSVDSTSFGSNFTRSSEEKPVNAAALFGRFAAGAAAPEAAPAAASGAATPAMAASRSSSSMAMSSAFERAFRFRGMLAAIDFTDFLAWNSVFYCAVRASLVWDVILIN